MSIEDKLDILINLLQQQSINTMKPSCNITIAEWAVEWLETYKKDKLRPLTYQKYDGINRNYIIPLFGSMLISSVDCIAVQKIFNQIPYPREREHILSQLKQMFDKALKLRTIDYNPFLNIELPKHKKEAGYALTLDEERRFVTACKNDKYGDMYLVCLYAGLRRGEALALNRGDVDFDNRTISITKTYYQGAVHETKTEAGTRIAPISNALFPYLQKYRTLDKSARLFCLNEANAYRHMQKILIDAKLEKKPIKIHSLRHTFATRCYEMGIDEKKISKWCGHTDVAITLGVYTHCNIDHEEQQINILNKGVKKY